jgi:glutaredoxin
VKSLVAVVLMGACLNAACVVDARAAGDSQTVYKSIGPDGKVRYGDKPPVDGRLEKTMTFQNLPASTLPPSYLARLKQFEAEAAAAPPPPTGTVLYSAAWCGYCRKAKAYPAGHKLPFQEVDVDSAAGMAAFAQVGGGGIPVLQARGQTLHGFSPAAYDALFASAK